jgi:hypothetical protein
MSHITIIFCFGRFIKLFQSIAHAFTETYAIMHSRCGPMQSIPGELNINKLSEVFVPDSPGLLEN